MSKKELYCGFPSQSWMPCDRDCEYYKTCTRNPHRKEKDNKITKNSLNKPK